MRKGLLCLILHAHLPFVKHPEHDSSYEERWLYSAVTESYIPLLRVFNDLAEDDIPFRVTVSLSPPLLEMLSDGFLIGRYVKHLDALLRLAEKEVERTSFDPALNSLARRNLAELQDIRRILEDRFRFDLVKPWRDLESAGYLELITSAATHGYLPLMLRRESVKAQLMTGSKVFRRHFGHEPLGFWLPECAYTPVAEPFLKKEGIRYFVLETHGILHASPRPKYGFYAPIVTPERLLCFGRDPDCSKQVWSQDEGYPGDPWYRDFYRDIGYDLPEDYLGEALPGGARAPVGLRYWRITEKHSAHKELYWPEIARERAWEHAGNFMFWRTREAQWWSGVLGRSPVMVAPYDAELLGHWWYEGPMWLEFFIRRMHREQRDVVMISPSQYPEFYPINQVARPAESSWGYKGYHEVWLEGSNDWLYRHLHHAEDRMIDAARRWKNARGLRFRALCQAARELLLAQSSDWPFIMKTGTVPGYARHRFITHMGRFQRLLREIEEGAVDPVFLKRLEETDSLFPDVDYRVYA